MDERLFKELDTVMQNFTARDPAAIYIPLQEPNQTSIDSLAEFYGGQKFSGEAVGLISFEDLRDTIKEVGLQVGSPELLKYWYENYTENGKIPFFEHKESTWLFLKIIPQFAGKLRVVK